MFFFNPHLNFKFNFTHENLAVVLTVSPNFVKHEEVKDERQISCVSNCIIHITMGGNRPILMDIRISTESSVGKFRKLCY